MEAKNDGKTPSGIPLPPANVPLAGSPAALPLESVTKGGNPTWMQMPHPDSRPAPTARPSA
ncbi:MAG: hypothetical protein ACR2JY_00995 [Chloroflexota bacterium]